jgi:hypothetical protein
MQKRCEVFSFSCIFCEHSANIFSKCSKNAARTSIRISGNRYWPVFECSYFFSESDPYKICGFEFWVPRPKRLALVAATALCRPSLLVPARRATSHMAKEWGIVLADMCCARALRGGGTRQGVVLTDLQSLLDCP